ncbi:MULTISPECIES: DUF742 domain-containing protein [unclassified Streptomyces]|uniref:DUF742 domain-containing protein n=1 Tax=Streptomycetaceae TaxID=2062 RepID=UPI002E782997|nr:MULTISPECIES: DUF742 domain-containing protein [unclassified Streptomyces]MED7952912.1 DUF742 domain-containing protein [Streptomyces sp. BE303]MEE1821811.1 DUF742 domain-containing protein [Streptomyces sp. BE20]
MSTADQDWGDEAPERLYVITRGRGGPAGRTAFDLVTLIVSRSEPTPTMPPEHAAILRICGSPLSVAEISAYLRLPVSAVTVLLADLLDEERIEARASVPAALLPDRALLEAVMHGLQRL